jgi:phosphatidylethanolamine/phosphatidyl-N-methylethanolamine N-methyltransferase
MINDHQKAGSILNRDSLARRRYDRWAKLFNLMEGGDHRDSRFARWRSLLWSKADGRVILEIGVGTGASFPYYPAGVSITAVDFSANMLKFAKAKAAKLNKTVTLEEMDVQALQFPDNTFDNVVASLVFCSVPGPMQGLSEIRRVLKPGGKAVLLEHVVSSGRVSGKVMNLLNPLVLWTAGDNINRHTIENVAESGLIIEKVSDLTGIFKLIEARKSTTG